MSQDQEQKLVEPTKPNRMMRRKRSKNGERRQRVLIQADKNASLLMTQLAATMGITKTDVLNFALQTLASAVQEQLTEKEVADANALASAPTATEGSNV